MEGGGGVVGIVKRKQHGFNGVLLISVGTRASKAMEGKAEGGRNKYLPTSQTGTGRLQPKWQAVRLSRVWDRPYRSCRVKGHHTAVSGLCPMTAGTETGRSCVAGVDAIKVQIVERGACVPLVICRAPPVCPNTQPQRAYVVSEKTLSPSQLSSGPHILLPAQSPAGRRKRPRSAVRFGRPSSLGAQSASDVEHCRHLSSQRSRRRGFSGWNEPKKKSLFGEGS